MREFLDPVDWSNKVKNAGGVSKSCNCRIQTHLQKSSTYGMEPDAAAVEIGIDLRCSFHCREEGCSKSCIGRPGIDTDS